MPTEIDNQTHGPEGFDLRGRVAEEMARLLADALDTVPTPIAPSLEFTDALELLLPQLLRPSHPEWERESLDGLVYSSAVKTSITTAEFRGMCILISDQAVTPFELEIELLNEKSIAALQLRMGEAGGGGHLGISGPPYVSPASQRFLNGIESRAVDIDWVYRAAF